MDAILHEFHSLQNLISDHNIVGFILQQYVRREEYKHCILVILCFYKESENITHYRFNLFSKSTMEQIGTATCSLKNADLPKGLDINTNDAPKELFLSWIGIDIKERGKKYGKMMLLRIILFAMENGCSIMTLENDSDYESFYTRNGFNYIEYPDPAMIRDLYKRRRSLSKIDNKKIQEQLETFKQDAKIKYIRYKVKYYK